MTRRWLMSLVLAAALAHPRPAAAEPPPPADLVVQAAGAGKPLVVTVGASWCKPCRELETIEHQPDVERALAGVVYARYDLEGVTGGEVAERFSIRSVPTLMVIDSGGHLERI